jgi:hypothetical protein
MVKRAAILGDGATILCEVVGLPVLRVTWCSPGLGVQCLAGSIEDVSFKPWALPVRCAAILVEVLDYSLGSGRLFWKRGRPTFSSRRLVILPFARATVPGGRGGGRKMAVDTLAGDV